MPTPYVPPAERLAAWRIERPAPTTHDRLGRPIVGPCLVWTRGTGRDGYARITCARDFGTGTPQLAHRVAYALHVGHPLDRLREIPELDHLCRVEACSSPLHLEPVTHAVNLERGDHHWTARDRCPNGHHYTPENTRYPRTGGRRCIKCARARGNRWARASRAS